MTSHRHTHAPEDEHEDAVAASNGILGAHAWACAPRVITRHASPVTGLTRDA
jgi:hypothetical protein